jgi:hypothetical protein
MYKLVSMVSRKALVIVDGRNQFVIYQAAGMT